MAAILASVLYFCLKKVLETCDCLNNANCLHGKCVCLSGYSGDRCQNCTLFLFIFITTNRKLKSFKYIINIFIKMINVGIIHAKVKDNVLL